MTDDENIAHARQWVEKALQGISGSSLLRYRIADACARVLAAAVRAKGQANADTLDRLALVPRPYPAGAHESRAQHQGAEYLRGTAGDVPEPPR